jgi:extracellular elastinolytic metalloproteinase
MRRLLRGHGRTAVPTLCAVISLTLAAAWLPAGAAQPEHRGAERTAGFQGEARGFTDLDRRGGRERPTAAQRAAVEDLGAGVRWNDFGTPASLIDFDGALGAGLPQDPVGAARTWLRDHRGLFRLASGEIEDLELLGANRIGSGHAVLFRQRFEGFDAGRDGLVILGVTRGRVVYVSSTIAGDEAVTGSVDISAEDAIVAAARNVDLEVALADVAAVGQEDEWTLLRVAGLEGVQRARIVAVPTADDGVRPAFETLLAAPAESFGFTHFVDAETGRILIRESLIDYASDNPKWDVFPGYPPLDYSTTDTRVIWCGTTVDPDCERVVDDPASPFAWDVDVVAGTPTLQTRGNSARATEKWTSPTPGGSDQGVNFSSSPTRDYVYPWTNQWFEDGCDPAVFTSPEQNDIDAARANLFAMHNRMHDWSYRLGFTETTWNAQVHNFGRGEDENDPEHGNAQAGGISGGFPTFSGRDNANQFTPVDGVSPTTNMFLWQSIPGAFYAPCVDGDYDMSVIGHEYTHMISNRMVAGPDNRLVGLQANALGESWSDYVAMEYMFEYGFIPADQTNPFAVGAYVTGDDAAGIRNYGMNQSPLNYSDVGYDFVCTTNVLGQCVILGQVHADGEIWSATLFDLRQAMNARYGAGSAADQAACADGLLPLTSCPGNRRLIQLVFDAWLLMPGPATMLDARDAMLAADMTRFGGANQDLLWNGFARRGFGQGAASPGGPDNVDPVPDFTSPFANEATVTFKPVGDGSGAQAELYVGQYEARVTPIADTDPSTPLGATFQVVPGRYEFLARADGFGTTRHSITLRPGQVRDLPVFLHRNVASATNGATVAGDGVNLDKLIDDTEATNWAFIGNTTDAVQEEAVGKQVTVRLDPSQPGHEIRRVQVSAMLRPRIHTDPFDPGTQNRFSALRSFEILVCRAGAGVDCTEDDDFTSVLTAEDVFPSVVPRPRAPELIVRSFPIPRVTATHVRIVVLENQCTGQPEYLGEQDQDPQFTTDCIQGSSQDDIVRAAELQVFRR